MRSASEAFRAKRSQGGFTLFELMITLAVAGALVVIGVPTMRTFNQNNRLASASNDLLRSFNLARSEAIKRQRNVVLCASSDPIATSPACSYGAFKGWIVFEDTNGNWQSDGEPVIERHELLASTLTVRNDNNGIQSFNGSGFANPAGAKTPTHNIVICDQRGVTLNAGSSTARALLITTTGRVRVTKDDTDVTKAATATGSSCP
jgi:type IV fimbrial biogenesis protein FimT